MIRTHKLDASPITSKLWQGGKPKPGFPLPYDLVVLCAEEHHFDPRVYGHRPFGARARIVRCPLTDGGQPLAQHRIPWVFGAAKEVSGALIAGDKVLVTCAMGWNRSGLVSALSLMQLGVSVDDAIAAIRHGRGENALGNPHFVALLYAIGGRPLVRFAPDARAHPIRPSRF